MTSRHLPALFSLTIAIFGVGLASAHAQVQPAAFKSPISLTVGGIASGFEPDYVPYKLVGIGTYVDLNLMHHFGVDLGVEAEGRWLRFNAYEGITQDNYLIGPQVRVKSFWRARPYVKVLGGFSNMNFGQGLDASGRFTTIAYGGGVDFHLNRHWTVRAPDFEFQQWPKFLNSTLYPYGLSAGVGYRIF